MPDGHSPNLTATTVSHLNEVEKDAWDALANPPGQAYYPFGAWDFLEAMESSGSVRPETGWGPQHLLLHEGDKLVGAMPLYLKGHSRGEFVFDHAWADAYTRAGGQYYPKMLGAIPFTPATGPRLFAQTAEHKKGLATAAAQVTAQMQLSSLHITFPTAQDRDVLEDAGFLIRKGQQYRFEDQGFGDWQGFLDALASRKRKDLRKERERIKQDGLEIDWITGSEITEAHLDDFWVFYQDTGMRKWGSPYLTRTAFSLLAERMADKILLILARRDDRYIAGAFNMIGGDTLFGRYWGCTEHVPFLHFELCYYQAIDYALAHGLRFVDGGAQGEHKIARGYVPVATSSAHYITDPGFHDAVARYCREEASHVDSDLAYLSDFTPFKKS